MRSINHVFPPYGAVDAAGVFVISFLFLNRRCVRLINSRQNFQYVFIRCSCAILPFARDKVNDSQAVPHKKLFERKTSRDWRSCPS